MFNGRSAFDLFLEQSNIKISGTGKSVNGRTSLNINVEIVGGTGPTEGPMTAPTNGTGGPQYTPTAGTGGPEAGGTERR